MKFTFKFDSEAESIAFVEGISFVNDSSIDRIKIYSLEPEPGYAVSLIDTEELNAGGYDETLDYRRVK
jgi:hypothetical protein